MYYVFSAAVLVIAAFIFYRLFSHANEPDFELKPSLSDGHLQLGVFKLAQNSQTYQPHGKGLSLRLINKYVKKCYYALKDTPQNGQFDFQIRLLDNFHTLRTAIGRLKKNIKKSQFVPHVKGLPRVYSLCQLIVKSTDGVVNPDILKDLIAKYNAVTPLNYDEIQLLPLTLAYALTEFLCIYCSKAAVIASGRESAQRDADKGRLNLSNLNKNSYIYFFSQFAYGDLARSFAALCEKNDISTENKTQNFIHLVSGYNGAVEAGLSSLNNLDAILSDEFLLSLSPLNELLLSENIVYKDCTLPTKNVYLYHIARRAKKAKKGELYYARTLIDAAQKDKTDIAAKILPSAGSYALMRLYIAAVVILSAALCAVPAFFCGNLFAGIAIGVLLFPSAVALLLTLASDLNARFAFRRYLPRIKIPDFDTEQASAIRNGENAPRTLITYCGLVCNEKDIDELIFNMQTARYSNPHKMFSYAMLLDLPAGKEREDSDNALMAHCKKRFGELGEPRYSIFVRKRKKIDGQERFQGWEKKRGALLELNEYLLSGKEESFELILGGNHALGGNSVSGGNAVLGGKPKYIITLDSDTMLNSAHELVEILEHPFNARKCVVSLSAKINPYSVTTLFGKFSENDLGLNGYSSSPADVNYDIFDSGNYTGKGIYRLKEFNEKMKDFFPDNRLLSHDFIEGAVGGCGKAESAVESCPKSFSQSLSRSVRWLRGDWQLLPYLFKRVKNRQCQKCENPIMPIDKWHILCNMLFSLLPVTILAAAVVAVFDSRPLIALLFAFSYILLNALNAVRAAVLYRRQPFSDLIRVVFYTGVLPITAFYNLTAIVVTLVRLATKKKLLEWKIFKSSSQKITPFPTLICILGFGAAGYFIGWYFYILSAVFMLAPLVILLLNKAYKDSCALKPPFKEQLEAVAKKTWGYFELSNRELLISDNLQLHLDKGFADRTSPTNIGFDLLSAFCAFKLNFISKEESDKRIESIVGKIEKLPKWHGNLYNWTNLSGQILYPKYISTVDNGNLLACLLTVVNHSESLKERVQKLIDGMDLFKLFDEKRGLLRIGFSESERVYEGHYDLLASEAMLTYLMAIGTGKIPKIAFYNLNRVGLRAYGNVSLASWGGGLFEYLMNCVFLRYPRFSMLSRSAKSAVNTHIKTSKKPFWGVSESQYNRIDAHGNYQYRSFGAPKIALSESAQADVKAPYASLLALPVCPKAVQKNIAKMKRAGMDGEYGFFESMDKEQVIKTYMTHHQGMILASICNLLCDNAVIKALKSLPQIAACELLLTQSGFDNVAKKPHYPRLISGAQENERIFAAPSSPMRLNFLSNGNYHVIHNAAGGSQSYLKKMSVSRNESEFKGFRVYVKEIKQGNADFEDISLSAEFESYKTVYNYAATDFKISQTCTVLPNLDGEMRKLDIKNLTERPLELEFLTYFEPALIAKIDDLSHKIFSSMKIRTVLEDDILIASRANAEKPLFLGHFLSESATYESSRHNLKYQSGLRLPSTGSPIYPVLSARVKITLKPSEKRELSAFIVAASSVDALINAKKIVLSQGYFEQSLSANYSFSRHLGLSRRISDLGSVLFNAPSTDVPPLAHLPTVIFEHKFGTERLGILLRELQRLSEFVDFNTVICYTESDGYFKKALTSLSLLNDGRLKNLHFYNNVTSAAAIEKISKTAVPYNAPIYFTPLPSKTDKVSDKMPDKSAPYFNPPFKLPQLDLDLNGKGFLPDSSFAVLPSFKPSRPWCNVIANSTFGTVISHSGGGYTYSKNSHMFKISELSNDPIADRPSEGVLFFERGLGWGATENPIKQTADYYVRHSFGFSEFKCNFNGAVSTMTEYCGLNGAKFYIAEIENFVDKERSIEAVFFVNLILGDIRERTGGFVKIKFTGENNNNDNVANNGAYIEAKNTLNGEKINIFCSENIEKAIINGEGNHLGGLNGVLLNPSAALCVKLNIKPKGRAEVIFKLISGDSQGNSSLNTNSGSNINGTNINSPDNNIGAGISLKQEAEKCFAESKAYFSGLSCVEVQTEDKALNHLMKWLPYQVLSSRFNARAGFYQAGGAIGFRDQLQDCLAMLYISPEKVRSHILLCAAHQFTEGDVQHWWHPPYKGVRTRITDDLLYLPFLTAEYISFTGDKSILGVSVPYLKGRKLADNEKDVYFDAVPDESEPLFNHCIKALFYNEINGDNLVLMGGGDWNDAMDNVGAKGKGVSVFNTIFLYYVINKFLPLIEDSALRARLFERAQRLKDGANKAWDGEWFFRAITDDGLTLGSKESPECKIDLLCQSWAALSGIADKKRVKTALKSAADRLIDFENGIIKLLDPPFEKIDAGYISKYPKGIRENGGQYTHAAVWYIMALLEDGQTEFACSLLDMINPVKRHLVSDKYLAEPYVLCGDVYGGEYAGVSGWSWYTGAAGWYYKCVIENVLGITKRGDKLFFSPNLPAKASIVKVDYKTNYGTLNIVIDNTAQHGNWSVFVNKIKYNSGYLQLSPSLTGKTITIKKD